MGAQAAAPAQPDHLITTHEFDDKNPMQDWSSIQKEGAALAAQLSMQESLWNKAPSSDKAELSRLQAQLLTDQNQLATDQGKLNSDTAYYSKAMTTAQQNLVNAQTWATLGNAQVNASNSKQLQANVVNAQSTFNKVVTDREATLSADQAAVKTDLAKGYSDQTLVEQNPLAPLAKAISDTQYLINTSWNRLWKIIFTSGSMADDHPDFPAFSYAYSSHDPLPQEYVLDMTAWEGEGFPVQVAELKFRVILGSDGKPTGARQISSTTTRR